MTEELETSQETEESAETTEQEQTEQTDISEPADLGAEPTEPKTVPVSRFNEVYGKAKQAERDAEYWRAEAQKKETATPPETQPTGEPQPEQFEEYNDYVKALTKWEIKQEAAAAEEEEETRQADEREVQFYGNLSQHGEKYEDFDQVVFTDLVKAAPNNRHFVEPLHDSEQAAEVLYYLGKNPQEARRIASLSPVQAAREIGKLEAKFSGPNPPVQKSKTNAPGPTSPVGGGETPPKKLEDMTTEEYRTHRRAGGT